MSLYQGYAQQRGFNPVDIPDPSEKIRQQGLRQLAYMKDEWDSYEKNARRIADQANENTQTTLDQLAQSTPYQVIGTAFTDLAGDNRTKSFAELYVDGLNDKLLYENPETGEKLPKDNMWMKDIKNNGVLSQLLAKFITNTMREVYGTVEAAKPLVDIKSKTNYYRNYYNEVREGLKLNPKELVKKYVK